MSGSTAIEAQPQRISQQLCTYLAELRYEDMPQRVVHEGRRGVLDWLGCALAGSTHPTIDLLIGVQQEIGSLAQATVIGRKLKLGLLDTALANGQIGHVLDYDDTHIAETTVMHTSSPLLAAMFALSEREKTNGRDFLLAYAAGFEVGIRSGLACPHHQSGGWHMTATRIRCTCIRNTTEARRRFHCMRRLSRRAVIGFLASATLPGGHKQPETRSLICIASRG